MCIFYFTGMKVKCFQDIDWLLFDIFGRIFWQYSKAFGRCVVVFSLRIRFEKEKNRFLSGSETCIVSNNTNDKLDRLQCNLCQT